MKSRADITGVSHWFCIFYSNILQTNGVSARKHAGITQACEDFAARIIIGEMGYTKCRDSKNVNGSYVSRTDFLQFHTYVIS
jgi:hypothetical protein